MKNVDTLHLPEDVTHIHMNCYSSGNINNMSDKIKFLKFSSFLTSKIKKFPASIETIILPQLYNRGIENMPESVKHIEFGDYFNKPIDFSQGLGIEKKLRCKCDVFFLFKECSFFLIHQIKSSIGLLIKTNLRHGFIR